MSRDICLTFSLSPIAAPRAGDLLIMEMRIVTSVKSVNERTSYGRTDDLLGMAIKIMSDEKSVD